MVRESEYQEVWCNQCKEFVKPVDRYARQRDFDTGAFCAVCGEPVDLMDNPMERVVG